MELHKLDDTLTVAPQISVADVAEAARAGFRTLVSNRPDGEGADQPATDAIAEAAREQGLEWIYLPVQSGNVTDEDVERFAPLLEQADKPILAFCRTGTRCSTLWALSRARRDNIDQLLNTARSAGYDLEAQRERMASLASRRDA
ncbi:TIGR01244 family sulfur transferase [Marinobacter bohaiensis]|uniref:TIGR01244 family sulfur transferase n=1 Tax=Marinobacter bohaiensis TaxID=2201898 RepID=UPI000DACF495|nr:TIGR01244 family sulfur transferase [Marinobacter bohaiensis]